MKIYIQKYIEKHVERILMDLFLQLDNIKEKNVHARGGVVLVISGTNPESKNAIQHRRVSAAIRQITPAARPIQSFWQTKILPDYRCCPMKEYQIKEVQPV